MNLISLLFIFAMTFSFANTEKKYVLLGFDKYTGKRAYSSDEQSETSFSITLKSYTNNYDILNETFCLISLINSNGRSVDEIKFVCEKEVHKKELTLPHSYSCIIEKNIDNITSVQLKNYNIIDFSGKVIIPEDEILMSSFALKQKNEIQNYAANLSFNIFNLYNINYTKNEISLYGNLDTENKTFDQKFNLTLNPNENPFNCSYYNNTSNDSRGIDMITFSTENNINDNLNGKMLIPTSSDHLEYILIFTNGTDDSIIYSTEEVSSADLYGFGNYSQPGTNKNATNTATFLGTINILKKFVRFQAIITYLSNSTLRFLNEITVNATGIRDSESIDFDNGVVKYQIEYNNTANMKNILKIESLHDYKFSDNENNFPSSPAIISIVGYYINLTNTAQLENPVFINFGKENPIIDRKTFSFKFGFNSSNSNISITNKQKVFLNYTSMETSETDELDCCSIENNTNIFTINCEPTKDVYTLLNSLIINIPAVPQNRRLRFLQNSGNNTIYAPKTASGDIQFEYNPEINTFGRKASKKKGLSGGAIAAIVLATIAAVAAVAAAIFFLNRGPVNPIKTSTEMNLPNSTTNINN